MTPPAPFPLTESKLGRSYQPDGSTVFEHPASHDVSFTWHRAPSSARRAHLCIPGAPAFGADVPRRACALAEVFLALCGVGSIESGPPAVSPFVMVRVPSGRVTFGAGRVVFLRDLALARLSRVDYAVDDLELDVPPEVLAFVRRTWERLYLP